MSNVYEYNRLQGILDILEACKSISIHNLARNYMLVKQPSGET